MTKRLPRIAFAATALSFALSGVAQAHVSPPADTNPATPARELPVGTNLVLCSNHAASTLFASNVNSAASTTPYRAETFTSAQCKPFQLESGTYTIGGYTTPEQPSEPCVNSSTDPNYPDCKRPQEWIKVFHPDQSESTWVSTTVTIPIGTAPATPSYGVPNNSNLNYPGVGTGQNVTVVSVSFARNPDAI